MVRVKRYAGLQMKTTILAALGIALLVIRGSSGQDRRPSDSDLPILTVCEALSNLSKYNGEAIVLVGKLVGTMEGSWLVENCDHKLVTEGYTWDNAVSLTYGLSEVEPPPSAPTGFKWDSAVLELKLTQVQKTTKLEVLKQYNYTDKWFAVYGRFETRLPLQVAKTGGGELRGYGFGHLGAAPARLIAARAGRHELKANPDSGK